MAAQRGSLSSETPGVKPCLWVRSGCPLSWGPETRGRRRAWGLQPFPLLPQHGDLGPLQGRLLRPLTSSCGAGPWRWSARGRVAAQTAALWRTHLLPVVSCPGPACGQPAWEALCLQGRALLQNLPPRLLSVWLLFKQRTLILVSSVYTAKGARMYFW